MAGFGETVEAQAEDKKDVKAKPTLTVETVKAGNDLYAHLRAEEDRMREEKQMTHMFVGIAGHDGP